MTSVKAMRNTVVKIWKNSHNLKENPFRKYIDNLLVLRERMTSNKQFGVHILFGAFFI